MEYDEDDRYIFVSIYRQYHNPIIRRLRHIWQIVRHGHPYGDDVVIEVKDAKKLANFIKSAMVKK